MNINRKTLLSCKEYSISKDGNLTGVAGVYVIPSRRKHESGWTMMDLTPPFTMAGNLFISAVSRMMFHFVVMDSGWIAIGPAGLFTSGIATVQEKASMFVDAVA